MYCYRRRNRACVHNIVLVYERFYCCYTSGQLQKAAESYADCTELMGPIPQPLVWIIRGSTRRMQILLLKELYGWIRNIDAHYNWTEGSVTTF